jgi:hypothetical protein
MTIAWPECWNTRLDVTERARLEEELRAEACSKHPLHGVRVTALATGEDPDDVIFRLQDGRYAIVHLTWNPETDPKWPWAQIFSSLEDLLAAQD